MKIAYFDCFSGISGDLTLGALIDLGAPFSLLEEEIRKLPIKHGALSHKIVMRSHIAATKIKVEAPSEHHHRPYREIKDAIESSALAENVKSLSLSIFDKLARAEAKIHQLEPADVCFHEVGAYDSIVDIVGTAVLIKHLRLDRIVSSALNVGSGSVKTQHGLLPVPAPATTELLKGVPIYAGTVPKELTTPTGAAIITTIADEFGELPTMRPEKIGYGAGEYDLREMPNVLRVLIGQQVVKTPWEKVVQLETNIDDLNPEFFEYVMERLFKAGALDVFLSQIVMKKTRPGACLTVLGHPHNLTSILDIIFTETSTLGVRISELFRIKVEREIIDVETRFGLIPVKCASWDERTSHIAPEYDFCKKKALEKGVPLKEIYNEAIHACKKHLKL